MSGHPPRGADAADAVAAQRAKAHAAPGDDETEEADLLSGAPSSPATVRSVAFVPRQRVGLKALEIVAHKRRWVTQEEIDETRSALVEQARAHNRQQRLQLGGGAKEAEDDEEDEDWPTEEQEKQIEQLARQDVFTASPASAPGVLRIRRRILERQLEPLARVRTAAEVPAAQQQAVENLIGLGVFSSEPLPEPQCVLHMNLDKPVLPGNAIRTLYRPENLAHPTFLERLAERAAKCVGLGGNDDDAGIETSGADGEDEEGEDDVVGVGGFHIPSHLHVHPLAVSVILPAEKRPMGLKTGLNTAGSVNSSDFTLTAALNGPLGYGESWQMEVRQGADSQSFLDADSNSLSLQLTVPELLTRRSRSTIGLSNDKMHMAESSLAIDNKSFSFSWAPYTSRHLLRYELTQRQLRAVSQRLPEQPAPAATTANATTSTTASLASTVNSWWPWSSRGNTAVAASASTAPAAASASDAAGASPPVGATPSAVYPAMSHVARKWREPSPTILAAVAGPVGVGHSLKSSLHYQYAYHSASLDSRSDPSQGWSAVLRAEYAGMGGVGDARFTKVEGEGRRFWRLPFLPPSWKASVGFGGLTQYVHNLSPSRSRVFLGDRLWLGSALTLRGQPVNTCGPRDGEDVLGGELALATAAHFGMELRPGIRAHLFWNAGNLLGMHNDVKHAAAGVAAASVGRDIGKRLPFQGQEGVARVYPPSAVASSSCQTLPRGSSSASHLARALWDSSRHSVGAGVSCDFAGIRFELHAAKVLSQQPQDYKPDQWPIQFGLGLQWV